MESDAVTDLGRLQGDGGAHAAGILFGLVRGPEARKAAIASPEVVALLVAALQVGTPQAVAWYGNFDIVLFWTGSHGLI